MGCIFTVADVWYLLTPPYEVTPNHSSQQLLWHLCTSTPSHPESMQLNEHCVPGCNLFKNIYFRQNQTDIWIYIEIQFPIESHKLFIQIVVPCWFKCFCMDWPVMQYATMPFAVNYHKNQWRKTFLKMCKYYLFWCYDR